MKLAEIHLRDPFVYREGPDYYLYGSSSLRENAGGFDAYRSRDLQEWTGPERIFSAGEGFWGTRDFWAPEMHAYRGAYYLIASFKAEGRGRATSILHAASPMGPFEPFGAEQITPAGWESLDGTLYVDEAGLPYMVFCREWVQVRDGEMHAVPLEADLSGPAGPAVRLFYASDAPWARSLDTQGFSMPGAEGAYVTDGPWLYRGTDGSLRMLWSSFSEGGYTIGLAVSGSGTVYGPWRQVEKPVFSGDGGHCMLFEDVAGRMLMAYHRPNRPPMERPVFRPVRHDGEGLAFVDA